MAFTSARNGWAAGSFRHVDHDTTALIERWNGHQWQRAAIAHPGVASQLFGVSAASATSASAVGTFRSGSTTQPLLLHWNGTSWKRATGPAGLSGSLQSVYAISARNAWAAGEVFHSGSADKALLLHWNGSRWTRDQREPRLHQCPAGRGRQFRQRHLGGRQLPAARWRSRGSGVRAALLLMTN